MWVLRVHTGQQKGQTFQLNPGSNTIGRGPNCDITINNNGISKTHAKIDLQGDTLTITDMGSSNGTFVDGLKVTSKAIGPGEKITLHNVLFDVHMQAAARPARQNVASFPTSADPQSPQGFHGNAALNYQQPDMAQPNVQGQYEQNPHEAAQTEPAPTGFSQVVNNYVENVVMPGVYKIPESLDFKWTLGLFVGFFIVFVTVMSSIPLMRILKGSIESESRQRALTIAKTEALINRGSIQDGIHSTLSINFSSREPGVEESYIIDAIDGTVLAPSSKTGSYPDIEYIHEARKRGLSEGIKQIDDSTIVSIVGISAYNNQTGANSNKAYAVILYDMGNLAVDNNKTISLLIQTLFIALIVGSLLFFFLYKIITHPIVDINNQLDQSLKDSQSDIRSDFQFPQLQALVSNINSALTRAFTETGNSAEEQNFHVDRTQEMGHLAHVIGFAAIIIQASDKTISALNPAFEDVTNHSSSDLLYGPVENILDQALKLSVDDLISQLETNPQQMCNNQLDINGEPYEVTAHSVWGQNEAAYYVITLLPGGAE